MNFWFCFVRHHSPFNWPLRLESPRVRTTLNVTLIVTIMVAKPSRVFLVGLVSKVLNLGPNFGFAGSRLDATDKVCTKEQTLLALNLARFRWLLATIIKNGGNNFQKLPCLLARAHLHTNELSYRSSHHRHRDEISIGCGPKRGWAIASEQERAETEIWLIKLAHLFSFSSLRAPLRTRNESSFGFTTLEPNSKT